MTDRKSELLDMAVTLLAEWCVRVQERGTSYDDWDWVYKEAAFGKHALREMINAAMDKARLLL
jgi:hypothetical protein